MEAVEEAAEEAVEVLGEQTAEEAVGAVEAVEELGEQTVEEVVGAVGAVEELGEQTAEEAAGEHAAEEAHVEEELVVTLVMLGEGQSYRSLSGSLSCGSFCPIRKHLACRKTSPRRLHTSTGRVLCACAATVGASSRRGVVRKKVDRGSSRVATSP